MVMPRKGSRLITVDGTRYRWMVRHKPTYPQAIGARLRFAVEFADIPGRVLSVVAGSPRPDNWLGLPGMSVTPRVVAGSVRKARAAGWEPIRTFRLEIRG